MKRIVPTILFCFGCIFLGAQTAGDYQSVATGNWNALATWQTYNGSAWVAAGVTPTNANANVITIQAGNTVTITAAVTIDQVVVNGTLNLNNVALTVANGAGDDIIINNTFGDFSNTSIVWNAGAAWSIAPGATLIRTGTGAPTSWQNSYSGGIANIPATANWISRRGASTPTLTTVGAVYPNLTIENNAGTAWTTAGGSTFNSTSSAPLIKGNLNIGGSGTNTVDFLMNCTSTAPTVTVLGDVFVKTGCTIRNYGNGFDLAGNLTVNGTINYDANDGRKIVFSGANNQTVNGPGTLNIFDMTLNKSAGTVTLNRAITVDNLSTFTGGVMISTSTNLLNIAATGTVAGANNSSFVSGPVRYYGTNAFTFPVGKNADYQPLAIGGYTPTGGAFWTENFNNGCTSNCQAATYVGANGAWTVTNTGANGPTPNLWFVSCAENGQAVGGCGAGCGANATLHLGAVGTSDCGCLVCPSGDCGAAYDACNGATFCGGVPTTDKRAESPTINCTGKVSIILGFKYIENGQGSTDNATVWYFDGSTWAQIDDPPKVILCGGQGTWTARSIALPASADNNPNVKIGFRWVNNADGAGNDPSFAVDDVTLSTTPESFTCEYFYANPQVVYNNNLAPTLSSISACEYWVLDRLPLTSTAATTVTLTWDGNSCPLIPQLSDTRVAHFDLTTWQDEGNGGNTGTTAAGTVTSAAAVTYFSPFTIGLIPPTPLPIEMLNFSGVCNNGTVDLKWATASETNNDFFTIERSIDGANFSAIGNVDGSGNSTALLHYRFTDYDAMAGMNYYRIRQTDFNGQFSFGKIIAIDTKDCGNKNLAVVHSFFNGNDFEIDYVHSAGPVTIEIYNSEGKLMCRYFNDETDAGFHIDAADWGKAIYFYRVSDGINSVSGTILR
jgi:hypothetical protein